MIQLTQTGAERITEQDFLALHPSLSFPTPIPFSDYGWFVIAPAPVPTFDPVTSAVQEISPVYDTNHWIQQWSVVSLSAEQIAANQAAKVEQDNSRIKAEIAALDLRRIRPIAEGDTAYLTTLNAQITALRAQLK